MLFKYQKFHLGVICESLSRMHPWEASLGRLIAAPECFMKLHLGMLYGAPLRVFPWEAAPGCFTKLHLRVFHEAPSGCFLAKLL